LVELCRSELVFQFGLDLGDDVADRSRGGVSSRGEADALEALVVGVVVAGEVAAVQNNAMWCDLVCRSLGIPTAVTASLWSALRRSPPLYPDVITLSPGATDDDVVQAVSPGRGCSIKDSFAELDLEKRGFEVLFEARWIYRPPMVQTATRPGSWTVIESEAELTEWSDAAGDLVSVPGDVLRDRTVRVLAATEPSGITGGAIANRTGQPLESATSSEMKWRIRRPGRRSAPRSRPLSPHCRSSATSVETVSERRSRAGFGDRHPSRVAPHQSRGR
jgi:hypothetical protein